MSESKPDNGSITRLCHWCSRAVTHSLAVASEQHYHCGCDKRRPKRTSPRPEGGFYADDKAMIRAMFAKYGHSNGWGIGGNTIHPPRRSKAFAK